jgi:hypothetical protein
MRKNLGESSAALFQNWANSYEFAIAVGSVSENIVLIHWRLRFVFAHNRI